jgi:cyclopropane-fatty-acyl-phospholipid synthase
MKAENIISELLTGAGVNINGKMPWDIQIHDDRLYRRLLNEADLGLGESYMEGWWDCEALE